MGENLSCHQLKPLELSSPSDQKEWRKGPTRLVVSPLIDTKRTL